MIRRSMPPLGADVGARSTVDRRRKAYEEQKMSTETLDRTLIEEAIGDVFADLWAVIVHDDDVTTFQTVIKALVELFQHTEPAAQALAWTVHRSGLAQVALGSQEFAQDGVTKLVARGIRASAEPLKP